MKTETISLLKNTFESYAYEYEGVEYWLARDLQELLAYTDWRNFLKVIEKAQTACKNSEENTEDHFVEINKMVRKLRIVKQKYHFSKKWYFLNMRLF